MQRTEVMRNLDDSLFMYEQIVLANMHAGCLEVSVRALGGSGVHFLDLLDREERLANFAMTDFLQSKGLRIEWSCILEWDVSPADICELLENIKLIPPGFERNGKRVGHLCVFLYSDQALLAGAQSHAIAILRKDHLARDIRRTLHATGAYPVVDTNGGGFVPMTPQDLANYARYVAENGGECLFLQVWQVKHR